MKNITEMLNEKTSYSYNDIEFIDEGLKDKVIQRIKKLINGIKSSQKKEKEAEQLSEEDKNMRMVVKQSLIDGYFYNFYNNGNKIERDNNIGDKKVYVCTLENVITAIFNPETTGINAKVLSEIIDDINKSGEKVKFYTNKSAEAYAKKEKLILIA